MERVLGIGGFFVASPDPAALGAWYARHLGVDAPPERDGDPEWQQQAGPTVFAAFERAGDNPHLGPSGWGLNFRVGDLAAMVSQLREAGIAVEVDDTAYPYGRFASLHDPDGNPVQLWQPA